MRQIPYLLAFFAFFSCDQEAVKQGRTLERFEIPTITSSQEIDSVDFFANDSLASAHSEFISKYKFSDSIVIREEQDTLIRKDFISEYSHPEHDDSLRTDGFQLKADYESTIEYKQRWENSGHYYFPVFAINETQESKMFISKDGHVFAIQEALDSNKMWRPIEARPFDFCGVGYRGLKIHPKEFALFLMPKYQGDLETWLRVRLKVGDNIYVSKPYKGTIKSSQFYVKREKGYSFDIDEPSARSIIYWFYGSVPKECADF